MSGSDGSGEPGDDAAAADPHVRAGELVLGVLTSGEAAGVRRAAMTDFDLADAIVRWEVQLAPLADAAGLLPPPAELWPRIEASVAAPQPGTAGNVVALGGASGNAGRAEAGRANDNQADDRRVGLWRGATAAALALAAVLAAVAFLPHPAAPVQIAALVPASAPAPAFLAQVGADNVVVVSAISPAAVPNNRDLELWLLPPGAAAPVSLGVLPATGRTLTLPGPQPAGTQLLVSLEPRGGSTTGQPTGPVLYGGALGRS